MMKTGSTGIAVLALATVLICACTINADIAKISGNNPLDGADASTADAISHADSATVADGASSDARSDDAVAQCNNVTAAGNDITGVAFAEMLPAAAGGAIADGIYDLVEDRIYGGPGAIPGPQTADGTTRATCVVSGQTWQCADVIDEPRFGKSYRSASTQLINTSGTTRHIFVQCGEGNAAPAGTAADEAYTATATSLKLFHSQGNGEGWVFVYQRRP